MNTFWEQYPDIKEDLVAIKAIIQKVNKTSESYLDDSIDYLVQSGGKLLRPALVMVGAKLEPEHEKEKIRNVAAAIETLHMATLVHDDIIDDSQMRRGQLSIQAKYSKEYAVYMGDYLFTQVFMMLSQYDYTRENLYDLSKGISRICIGEMLQNRMRYKADVTTKDYLKIISGKTAGLFALSLGIGGHLSGASDKDAKTLARIGYNLGMAFQILDDLLDYKGDTAVVGKDLLADLANGYFTLPVIYAMRTDESEELIHILNDMNSQVVDIEKVVKLIKISPGVDKARELAKKYTARAMKHIDRLPDGETKTILKVLVPDLLRRKQ